MSNKIRKMESLRLLSEGIRKSNKSLEKLQVETDFSGEGDRWSATPRVRNEWLQSNNSLKIHTQLPSLFEQSQNSTSLDDISPINSRPSYQTLEVADEESAEDKLKPFHPWIPKEWSVQAALRGTPGLLIALILNLFLSTSFGSAIFPSEWQFPSEVPRGIGVQMFLFSSLICQICLTSMSEFPTAVGMMMVENIPFLQVICKLAISSQGEGKDTFATVFYTFALASIVVGVFFYLLGKFKLGYAVYFFPKHIIVGCIGGIGIFIFITGLEVSTSVAWRWESGSIVNYFEDSQLRNLWISSLALELFLRLCLHVFKTSASLLPPFFFIAIPPAFYLSLFILGIPISVAHDYGWFFDQGPAAANTLLLWELMDITRVNWSVVCS